MTGSGCQPRTQVVDAIPCALVGCVRLVQVGLRQEHGQHDVEHVCKRRRHGLGEGVVRRRTNAMGACACTTCLLHRIQCPNAKGAFGTLEALPLDKQPRHGNDPKQELPMVSSAQVMHVKTLS